MSMSPLYASGQLQALDVGSAVAVHALSLEPSDTVLDLCCAPGGKLALCAEVTDQGRGTVTGVDLSRDRMHVTKAVLTRLGRGSKTRLFVADGRGFDRGAGRLNLYWRAKEAWGLGMDREREGDVREDEQWGAWERDIVTWSTDGKRSSTISVPRRFEEADKRRGKPSDGRGQVWLPYDKVLVDAECTHDGLSRPSFFSLLFRPRSSPSPWQENDYVMLNISLSGPLRSGSISHILKYSTLR